MAKNQAVAKQEVIDPETGEILPPVPMGESAINIPDEALGMLDQYAGVGYSDKPEDGLAPILSILQSNSGEVQRQHERYQEGAEPGKFIIRSLRQIMPGEPGLLVQPFGFTHVWVEWTGDVGEGTPVARFDIDHPPEDMFTAPDPKDPKKTVFRRKTNMNRMVDTREHAVNLITGYERPYQIVVPMSGSNHTPSRGWTNQMRNLVYKGKQVPSFFRYYRLKTVFRKRGATQTWFGYHVDPGPFISDMELIRLGAQCADLMKTKPIEGNYSDLSAGEADEVQQSQPAGSRVQIDKVI